MKTGLDRRCMGGDGAGEGKMEGARREVLGWGRGDGAGGKMEGARREVRVGTGLGRDTSNLQPD